MMAQLHFFGAPSVKRSASGGFIFVLPWGQIFGLSNSTYASHFEPKVSFIKEREMFFITQVIQTSISKSTMRRWRIFETKNIMQAKQSYFFYRSAFVLCSFLPDFEQWSSYEEMIAFYKFFLLLKSVCFYLFRKQNCISCVKEKDRLVFPILIRNESENAPL